MELYQLKYFLYASKYENISKAAQELRVAQPSISKAIRSLERELQVDLEEDRADLRREGSQGEYILGGVAAGGAAGRAAASGAGDGYYQAERCVRGASSGGYYQTV